MSTNLLDRLTRLSGRERILLAVLCGCVAPVAVWFLLLAPLAENRAKAEQDLREARALQVWVADRAADLTLLGRVHTKESYPPMGTAALEQSLIAAGLREKLSEFADQGNGVIQMRFETVSFSRLIHWLGEVEPRWGYGFANFRLDHTDAPGLVSAEISIRPEGS